MLLELAAVAPDAVGTQAKDLTPGVLAALAVSAPWFLAPCRAAALSARCRLPDPPFRRKLQQLLTNSGDSKVIIQMH